MPSPRKDLYHDSCGQPAKAMTFSDSPFLYPQRPGTPLETNFLRDKTESVEIIEKDASGPQRVISIGSPIPIVFGEFKDGSGGVWVLPPAARYGLQLRDQSSSGFSFGMVVSEGQIGPIPDSDICKGSFRLTDLSGTKSTYAYSSMPEIDYNYTFSETITTPGTPGTNDTVNTNTQTFGINSSNWYLWVDTNFVTFVTQSSAKSVNVSINVSSSYSSNVSIPFLWEVTVNNIAVGSGSSGGGSASFSYNAGYSGSWAFRVKKPPGSTVDTVRVTVSGTGTRDSSTVVPGTPSTPPVYTTTGLPLFPGAGGTFDKMSCLAVKGEYPLDSDKSGIAEQVRCFVRNGMEVKNVRAGTTKSSDDFIDLAYYLLKANGVSDQLIDLAGFQDASAFLSTNGLRFNGVVGASTNLREYLSAVAPGLMLKFVQDAGRFSFKPVLPVNGSHEVETGSIEPVRTFNGDSIISGSYRKSYYNTQRRKPFCAQVSWREQLRQLYSSVINTEFRYNGTAIDGPFETYDYSDFITDVNHASFVGNYIISSRARITHTISFSTFLDAAKGNNLKFAGQLAPMDIIRVGVDSLGVSTSSAAVAVSDEFYQVSRITETGGGEISIEAVHFPTDEVGASLIAADVVSAVPPLPPNNIPGVTPPPTDLNPPTVGIGILSVSPTFVTYAPGETITLTASHSGPATDVVYVWQGPAGTAANTTVTGATLSWTAAGAGDNGAYTVTAISATSSDSGKRASSTLDYKPFYDANGGSVSYSGNYKIHTFTSSGPFTILSAPNSGTLEYLVVGAGGQGHSGTSSGGGGGGGGGGVLTGSKAVARGTHQIDVGQPGIWGQTKSGANHSSAFGLTAYCGGDGSSQDQALADGGSGGGSAPDVLVFSSYKTGKGTAGQGNAGGTGDFGRDTGNYSAGGGGGASTAGTGGSASQSSTTGGGGGTGKTSSISGSSYVYGSGGGGLAAGINNVTAGAGGPGAGNSGTEYYSSGWKKTDNTASTNYGAGGSGGGPNHNGVQGVVIIRYQYK